MAEFLPDYVDLDAIDIFVEKLTPFKIEAVETAVGGVAADLGFPTDQAKYVLTLLLCYPLAMIHARLPGPTVKHLYNLVVGLVLAQFVFGTDWIHSIVSSSIVYLMLLVSPRSIAPYIVFIFMLGYMSASHMWVMQTNYMGYRMDHTGPQMILTIKLSSLAYNIYDGTVRWEKINKAVDNKVLARVNETQRKLALRSIPNPLEYFGYVFCFTSFFVGPAFEYKEYISSIEMSKFKRSDGSTRIPSNIVPALQALFTSLFCLGVFVTLGAAYPITAVVSEERLAMPLLTRVGLCWVSLLFTRGRYYFAWKVAEGSTILAGYGFDGYDEQDRPKGWSGARNIDIIAFELSPNVRTCARSWNMYTQAWLERSVYVRTGNSLVATYFVSAFWHGFYPGYYVFFMSVPLATELNRVLFKRVRPRFLEADGSEGAAKKLYDLVCYPFSSLAINYLVGPFLLMSAANSWTVLSSFYFSGHIIMAVMYVAVVLLVPEPKYKGKKQA